MAHSPLSEHTGPAHGRSICNLAPVAGTASRTTKARRVSRALHAHTCVNKLERESSTFCGVSVVYMMQWARWLATLSDICAIWHARDVIPYSIYDIFLQEAHATQDTVTRVYSVHCYRCFNCTSRAFPPAPPPTTHSYGSLPPSPPPCACSLQPLLALARMFGFSNFSPVYFGTKNKTRRAPIYNKR